MNTPAIIAAGESLTTEFKSDTNDKELTKAVACLANGQGGVLLIGIDDDGTVVGAKPRHGTATPPSASRQTRTGSAEHARPRR